MQSSRERTLSHAGSELGTSGLPHTEVRRGLFALPGGTKASLSRIALLAFLLSITSYTVQTELAQVVQSKLGYKKPFLSLWLGHSLFSVLLPFHLLLLVRTTGYPLDHWLRLISKNLDWQLSSTCDTGEAAKYGHLPSGGRRGLELPLSRAGAGTGLAARIRGIFGFDLLRLVRILFILTMGITIPSLSWYAAVPMTSMADITAIYNTFSVFALVFSVFFLGESWEKRKVLSVGLASFGVAIVAYGGSSPDSKERTEFSNPLLGSLLALLGALTMGAYEVIFTLIAKLPDEDTQAALYARPGSRRTRSRTISGAFVRTLSSAPGSGIARHSTEAGRAGSQHDASESGRGRGSANGRNDVRLLFDAAHEGEHEGGSETMVAKGRSHERTALVLDDALTSAFSAARASYESISPSRSRAGSPSPPHRAEEKGHGPSPLRQTYLLNNGNESRADLLLLDDHSGAPAPAAVAAPGASGFSMAADSEAESVLQDGEQEEIWAGATRLSRSVSRSSRGAEAHNVWRDDEEEEDDDDGEGRAKLLPSSRGAAAAASVATTTTTTTAKTTPHANGVAGAGDGAWIPPPLPFGLHANIMTSGIGYVTFGVLWIGVVVGHWTGLEPFELPPSTSVYLALLGVGLLGVLFNSTFTLLLALWGPVLASVSIIGATVLVEVADVVV
ncbi:hypothetical protein OC844_006933, partial [Tilletia horrida]